MGGRGRGGERTIQFRRLILEGIQRQVFSRIRQPRRTGHDAENPQPKHRSQANLLIQAHLQLTDAVGWQTQYDDIEHDVGGAVADVHEGVIGGRFAHDPVAPDGVYLEQGGEEEGDEPGDDDDEHDADDGGEAADGEDAGVEVEDGELDEGYGEDVEELEGEEALRCLIVSEALSRWNPAPGIPVLTGLDGEL